MDEKVKLRAASESVGWLNSEGPLNTSPQGWMCPCGCYNGRGLWVCSLCNRSRDGVNFFPATPGTSAAFKEMKGTEDHHRTLTNWNCAYVEDGSNKPRLRWFPDAESVFWFLAFVAVVIGTVWWRWVR